MPVPDFQSLTKPVLELTADGQPHKAAELLEALSTKFRLTPEEQQELLPSGRQTRMANRVHWAITYLAKCKLLDRTGRGVVEITPRGREVLADNPDRVTLAYLARYPELQEFRSATNSVEGEAPRGEDVSETTPDERLRTAHAEIDAALRLELLDRIKSSSPAFFEKAVLELLLAMGFGSTEMRRERLGRSGDDGLDGVIEQDALGLDRVYVQAKRWTTANVGAREIRDFSGALEMEKAQKGVFITTSDFTAEAQSTAERLHRRIVLINGEMFATLMVRKGVGVRTEQTFEIQKLDEDFFLDT